MSSHITEFFLKALECVAAIGLLAGAGFVIVKKCDEPLKIIVKAVLTVPFVIWCFHAAFNMGPNGLFVVMVGALLVAIVWTPHLGDLVTGPMMGLFDGGNERNEARPFYFIANARRKRGLYLEAAAEIRKQLQKFPNDYEGVMLLASIQAENLKDLPAAEIAVDQFCGQPHAPENRVAAAWTAMADWHLQFGADADAACASLQKIIARYPESTFALAAEQRIARLGGVVETVLARRGLEHIAVPEGAKNLGLTDSPAFLKPQEIDPGENAAAHLRQLETHPDDSETREKLAMIYAKDFKRLDLATAELFQLINEPRHTPRQVAGWLNQLANFQLELGADIETVRLTLETIVARFPDLPIAEITQRRLALLKSEFKGKETTPTIRLGVYEQNIGLKYGLPRKL